MPATATPTLVVGAGQAGISLVSSLRDLGDTGPVVLIGDEDLPPYERPPLTKTYLRGEHDRESLVLRGRAWFTEHGIELVTGDAVVGIDRDAKGGVATTVSGRRLGFARLALTTGASERRLPVEGFDLEGVLTVRSIGDADRLAAALATADDVVVVGGGFIGLEVAASARALGHDVTVLEMAPRVLSRAVTPVISDFFRAAHERRGVRIRLGANVIRLVATPDGARVQGVALADGTVVPADVVVVGIGAEARTDLAVSMGLDVEPRGILVDERARTSDGLTVAAGDCSVGPNPFARGRAGLMRLESVQHATDHARTAAATLLGHPAAYAEVPWFWSDQADLRLQIAGLPEGADQAVVRGDVGSERFSVLSYRDGLLVAIEAVGSSTDYLAVKRALEKGMTIPADAAGDPTTPLKRAIRPA